MADPDDDDIDETRPRGRRGARSPRPAPRPEDRLDWMSIIKGMGIAVVALFIVSMGTNALYQAMLPQDAKDTIDRAEQEVRDLDAELNRLRVAERDAPEGEAKLRARAEREALEQRRETRIDELVDEIEATIPNSVEYGIQALQLLVFLLAAAAAGYFASRFARARKPAAHGAVAGGGLMILSFGGAANPVLLILQAGILVGGGVLGGLLYVRRKGPWDGVMPERPVRPVRERGSRGSRGSLLSGLGGGLFGPRRPRPQADPDTDEALDEDLVDVDDVVETELSLEEMESFDDDGPRQFGPKGRKKRRRRPPGTADDESIE